MTTCSDKKSPPEISDKLCKPPGFLFAALKNYLLSEKKPPLKNEAIKNAPRKTKLQNKCPPEICTARPHVQSAQKQPYLTSQFRGALLTQSVTLEFSQDTGCEGTSFQISISWLTSIIITSDPITIHVNNERRRQIRSPTH